MKKSLFTLALAAVAMISNANEDIDASNREYHAINVMVGRHVTDQKPQGNVTVTNSNVTIKADKVVLDKGTKINLGSTLKVNSLH